MKTKNLSTKEFNEVVKGAKVEINGTFKNPFVVINLLNKAVKGDFAKVANCEINPENLKKVAKVCKGMHANRYAFDVCLFEKDSFGRFCAMSPFKGAKGDLFADYYDINNMSVLVYTDNKGREIVENEKGDLYTCAPISLTINGVFNAFAKVAKVDIIEKDKAAKEFQKAAKKAERIRATKLRELDRAKDKGIITEFEYNEKLKLIKAA
jgi:hypothetical protein